MVINNNLKFKIKNYSSDQLINGTPKARKNFYQSMQTKLKQDHIITSMENWKESRYVLSSENVELHHFLLN